MREMLNRKERIKAEIIGLCVKGKITARDAAQRLGLSVRQVENLKKKQREGISLLHGNCERNSVKSLSAEMKQGILEEYKEVSGLGAVNFTHFHEILQRKGVSVSYTAMRNVLVVAGNASPKKRRKSKEKHPTRERRQKFGELLQTDASPHDWLGIGEKFALHGFIDDARGVVTGLHLSKNECMDGYLEAFRQTLTDYGTPEALYADGLSIFFGKKKNEELTLEEELSGIFARKTQFGQICDTLGVQLIHARSCQAKGRVERLWETLQSRLPIEFAMRGIKTVEAANEFLKNEFRVMFNARFSVNEDVKSCFVPLPKSVLLDRLLSYKITRKLDGGGCFSWHNVRFKVEGTLANCKVTILVSNRLGVVCEHNDIIRKVKPLTFKNENIAPTDSVEAILSRFVFRYCFKNEHVA
jgi:transposase